MRKTAKKMIKEPKEGKLIKKNTAYEPWMCSEIIKIAEEGGHVAQMCTAIGIRSRDTFYRWLEEYAEFKEAYETAKLHSQAFYENLLLAGAVGKIKNFNFSSIAMIMNNKFSDDYHRSGGPAGTEINIGSINSIERLDTPALDKKIESLQRKLGLLPDKVADAEK